MTWDIRLIKDYYPKKEGAVTVKYELGGSTIPELLSKHELSIDGGQTFFEITPVGNTKDGFEINIEAKIIAKRCQIKCTNSKISTNAADNVQVSNIFTVRYNKPSLMTEPPVIENFNVQQLSGGRHVISYNIQNKHRDQIKHYYKIDGGEYVEGVVSGFDYIYNMEVIFDSPGKHIIKCKVTDIDGSNEVETDTIRIEYKESLMVSNHIRNLTTDSNNKGRYKIVYEMGEVIKTPSIHELKIDTNEFVIINPVSVDNINYIYYGEGLSVGEHNLEIKVTDTKTHLDCFKEFKITIQAEATIKQELFNAKAEYDISYNDLLRIVKEVMNNMKNDPSYDSNIGLTQIDAAYKTYLDKTVLLKDNFNKSLDIIGNKKTEESKDKLSQEIGDLTNALGSLENSMNDVFKDGILTEAEKLLIRQNLKTLSIEKVDVDNQYNSILGKFNKVDLKYAQDGIVPPDFTGDVQEHYPPKDWYLDLYNNFQNSYNNYSNKYRDLILTIDYLLNKEGIIDSEDQKTKDKAFNEYTLAIGEYSKQASLAIEGIARNESENSQNVVTIFKGEYIRTNKENSAKLSELTQTTNGLNEKVSEFKQTADQIKMSVSENTNNISRHYSEFLQTKDEISLKVNKNDVISAINVSPGNIRIHASKIDLTGYVTISSLAGGYTAIDGNCIKTGTLECSKLKASDDRPYIELFNKSSVGIAMAIDATAYKTWGIGDSIRLKRDLYNYVCVSEAAVRFYLGIPYRIPDPIDYKEVAKITKDAMYAPNFLTKKNILSAASMSKDVKIETITNDDMYNFVKDKMILMPYRDVYHKSEVLKISEEGKDKVILSSDFTTEDKVRDSIIGIEEDKQTLDLEQYSNTLAGALQVAIRKIEKLETEINNLKGGVK